MEKDNEHPSEREKKAQKFGDTVWQVWIQSPWKEAMMGQEIRNKCYAGVRSLKALLRSLDSYPVSNGEPVKDFRQRNIWIIFELQKKMTNWV